MRIRKNCIICEKPIYRSNSRSKTKLRRGKQSITCSPECSKTHIRIYNYFVQREKRWELKRK